MQLADDAAILRVETVRARRATAEDLARLYALHSETFAAVAEKICGEAAPDAVQDAFVRALTRVGTLRSNGALAAWVWRIVMNEARRRAVTLAEERREQSVHEAPPNSDADPRASQVRSIVSRLPMRQREVVFLRYFADLDEVSIAAILGIRRGTVAATLHQVHGRLRLEIETGASPND